LYNHRHGKWAKRADHHYSDTSLATKTQLYQRI
jgi:hypothetical protein